MTVQCRMPLRCKLGEMRLQAVAGRTAFRSNTGIRRGAGCWGRLPFMAGINRAFPPDFLCRSRYDVVWRQSPVLGGMPFRREIGAHRGEAIRDGDFLAGAAGTSRATTRLRTVASHSWSGPAAHFHQTFCVPKVRRLRSMPSFRVGCNWAYKIRPHVARLLVTDARRPAQNGQPLSASIVRCRLPIRDLA